MQRLSEIDSDRRWALAVSADRQWACLSAAGRRSDGLLHVESVDHRPGVAWVVDRCVEAFAQLGVPLRMHSGGAAAALVPDLEAAGVDVDEVSGSDYGKATGAFIDAVREGRVYHLGQRSLDKSLELADTRTSAAGATVWVEPDRADISPLAAATLALGAVALDGPSQVVPLGAWR